LDLRHYCVPLPVISILENTEKATNRIYRSVISDRKNERKRVGNFFEPAAAVAELYARSVACGLAPARWASPASSTRFARPGAASARRASLQERSIQAADRSSSTSCAPSTAGTSPSAQGPVGALPAAGLTSAAAFHHKRILPPAFSRGGGRLFVPQTRRSAGAGLGDMDNQPILHAARGRARRGEDGWRMACFGLYIAGRRKALKLSQKDVGVRILLKRTARRFRRSTSTTSSTIGARPARPHPEPAGQRIGDSA
jgi:hypothetical protein